MKDNKNKKPKGKKEKMVLAKDPKQAALAGVVLVLFFVTMIRNIVIYYQNEIATTPVTTAASAPPNGPAAGSEGVQGESGQPAQPGTPEDANNIYSQTMALKGENPQGAPTPGMPSAGKTPTEGDIDIMASSSNAKFTGKRVLITVGGSGRSNPFLPAGENVVPASMPKFSFLPPPPEQLATHSDADNVMGTTISGILYDKYSPSAIITIGGTDYLVKRGDTINRYHILMISKEQVVVQLGHNVYKAGVGQLLSQGQMNFNTIANLNKKFGGNPVSINVKKKGY